MPTASSVTRKQGAIPNPVYKPDPISHRAMALTVSVVAIANVGES
jgi:hypothetical protein